MNRPQTRAASECCCIQISIFFQLGSLFSVQTDAHANSITRGHLLERLPTSAPLGFKPDFLSFSFR